MTASRVARRVFCATLTATLASGCGLGLGGSDKALSVPAGVTSGGTVRIGIVTPASIDPAQAYDRDGEMVVRAMCDPLVEMDSKTGEVSGGLSKHVITEENGAGVTVTLKDGLRFSDGSPAVAKDVRTSLSRVASDSIASPLAHELVTFAGYATVHGDVPVKNENDPARSTLSGAVQVTKSVVTISPSGPDAEFGARLSRPWSAVTPTRISDRVDFPQQPVCVGPYRLAAPYKPGDKTFTLVRSKSYFAHNEALTAGGRGYPDSIVFITYASADAAFDGWLKGEVDVARVPRARHGAATPGGKVTTHATSSVEYVGLPTTVKPFDEPRVRRALSEGLDRAALLATRSDRTAVTGMFPSTLPGGLNDTEVCRSGVPPTAQLDKAKQLLAQAGISLQGVEVPLYFNDEAGSGNAEMMAAVAAQWKAAFGIVPHLIPQAWDSYEQAGRAPQGFSGPFRTSWSTPVPAPSNWISPLFLSQSIGDTNLSRFSQPVVDKNYERVVLKETDPGVRHRNEQLAVNVVCSSMPMVPVWSGTESFVVRDNVKSAAGDLQRPIDGDLNIRELYVSAQA